ncbi:MAG: hypothetical protein IKR04_05880 [Clostridia bacterium]|nr:hypothetical protein [Clostridia bacterium]
MEEFRDEDGFIDLERADLIIAEGSRNQIGSADIFKYWVDFAGTKVLLKEQKKLENEENGTIYSELYMHELCEEMDIESAHTDVFKIGNIKGVISFMAFDPEKEGLILTRELIGDMQVDGDAYDYNSVEIRIEEELVRQFKLSKKEAHKVVLERRLQKILQLYASEMDNHTENEGFLFKRNEDGSYNIRLCPMFDNERSFGLYSSYSEMMSDALYDSLERRTPILRHMVKSLRRGEDLSKSEISLLYEFSSKEEIRDVLLGNMNSRIRVGSNGMQIMLDDSKLPKFFSLTDATLAKLYMDSKSIIDNPDAIDNDELICHKRIVRLVDSLEQVEAEELIENIENKLSIPSTIKTQISRFSRMKSEVLHFAQLGRGEVSFYEEMADLLLKEKEKLLNKKQEIDL